MGDKREETQTELERELRDEECRSAEGNKLRARSQEECHELRWEAHEMQSRFQAAMNQAATETDEATASGTVMADQVRQFVEQQRLQS